MNLNELTKKIFPEDVMIAAVSNEVSEVYVYKLLGGERELKSDTAKAIMKTLKRLARINESAKSKKERVAGVTIK